MSTQTRFFSEHTAREKTLEQRRKDSIENSVKGRAMSVAREVIALDKNVLTIKNVEKMIKKARAHVVEVHRKLFDDTVRAELRDFLSTYFN